MDVTRRVEVGERLRLYRKALDWSQSETARRTGLGRSTIVLTEQGKTNPGLATLRRMADAFGVSVDEFISDAEPKPRLKVSAPEIFARLEGLPAEDRAMLLRGVWPKWTADVAADARAMEAAIAFERETGAGIEDVRRALIEIDPLAARRLMVEETDQAAAEAAYRDLLFEAVAKGELDAPEAAEKAAEFNAAA